MALTISTTLANALAAAAATAHGTNTVLEIRSGAKPANADAAASGTLLCSVTIAGAWTATGNAIAAADPAAANPAASGTAAHFRLKTSGGATLLDGTVTATGGGGDLTLGSTTITTGVPVDLGVPSFTVPVA